MSGNDDKLIQSIDCRQTYVYGLSAEIIYKNEKNKNG